MPIRDVRTRWNSTHAMMGRALTLKNAIDVWVFQYEDLRPLLLSKSEWEMVNSLHCLLEVCTFQLY
ncbi:hypothetical protein CONPUDRAFT_66139 [Coniophora puteana RWD-64-598 SS2]|uniref:Uncharacterized protein n=1 Tax=Coniophora puteana (strain RWD-64-598) TaxID=741705 RepID=A0A5M3M8F0_CONPW|nr:uncharacterized protein CONPUDRAFT_66139 [Coniophora puteana RWD-64-598 SS2]EIW75323.1 hypothetical protein CONPUDRAFT_66139 [Coniophora puteana RWD-64-598 SS2]